MDFYIMKQLLKTLRLSYESQPATKVLKPENVIDLIISNFSTKFFRLMVLKNNQ